jgi:naphthoate synthase/2-ketocyclohexanecarboxyl-CoA hydrolase
MTDDLTDIGYSMAHGVATITIDRPDRRNALRRETVVAMTEALTRAHGDPEVGVVVVTGAGEHFCAGGDLSAAPGLALESAVEDMPDVVLRLVLAFRMCSKPVIAKVRGYCIGMGNELNLLCDLTVASDTAVVAQAGPRVGSVPLIGGSELLPLVCGLKRAKEVLLLCRRYSGAALVEIGLANAVVPDADLDEEVDRWCSELLALSPQSLRLAKLSLGAAFDQQWSAVLHGVELSHWFGRGGDLLEGAAAFLEKRAPRFRRE